MHAAGVASAAAMDAKCAERHNANATFGSIPWEHAQPEFDVIPITNTGK